MWMHASAACLRPLPATWAADVVNFDFSIPGVSSISVDFHKYGYCSKGVSGLFFRNNELSRNQPFVFDSWGRRVVSLSHGDGNPQRRRHCLGLGGGPVFGT